MISTEKGRKDSYSRRTFLKGIAGTVLFGATAGASAVTGEKLTNVDIVPIKFKEETLSEEEERSQPFNQEYDILPAPGYPQIANGALVFTNEGLTKFLQDESKRLDVIGRTSDERPKAYKIILVMEDVDQYPSITLSREGYVSVEHCKLNLDKEGNFLSSRLEYLPRENNKALLNTIKIMPDNTQIPDKPNIIEFPVYKFPPQSSDRTVIYSTKRINASDVNDFYPIMKKFRDFVGRDFPLYIYNPGNEGTTIPENIQKMAGTDAVIPQIISEAIDIQFKEIVVYYELARAFYDKINGSDLKFQGDAELAKYRFNDTLKEFVETYTGKIPNIGFYKKGTEITEENDRVAVALQVFSIENYLNDVDRGRYYFGDLRRDPKAFFANLITVANFFGERFNTIKDDEETFGRQISFDIEQIGRPVYSIINAVNNDDYQQLNFIRGLSQTGLIAYTQGE